MTWDCPNPAPFRSSAWLASLTQLRLSTSALQSISSTKGLHRGDPQTRHPTIDASQSLVSAYNQQWSPAHFISKCVLEEELGWSLPCDEHQCKAGLRTFTGPQQLRARHTAAQNQAPKQLRTMPHNHHNGSEPGPTTAQNQAPQPPQQLRTRPHSSSEPGLTTAQSQAPQQLRARHLNHHNSSELGPQQLRTRHHNSSEPGTTTLQNHTPEPATTTAQNQVPQQLRTRHHNSSEPDTTTLQNQTPEPATTTLSNQTPQKIRT
ncbi:hypothetical protein NDU88_010724 [Pleurodeles waltl]|uniref:Uncharacterized protein n=1 Tax=Pleurodeles waltl TaxID=8319 RepID=A0AAV7S4U7_PLEWA|nr:hypothetical protein NDU88_010724 [Pleurodeles waltl]